MAILEPIPEAIESKYLALGSQLVEFAVVAVLLYLLGRFVVEPAIAWILDRSSLNETLTRALGKIVHTAVILAALAGAAGSAGFSGALGGSALMMAAITLALGLAAQDVLSNLVAGIFLVQDPKLNVGDLVKWNDRTGTIRDIGFRVTRIRTADNASVIVPNSELATNAISNLTVNDPIGISYDFGIGYGDDINEAKDLIIDVADSLPAVVEDPSPTVDVTELTDSAVMLTARLWIKKRDKKRRWELRCRFIREVHEACRAASIDLSTTSQHALSGEVAIDQSNGEAAVSEA